LRIGAQWLLLSTRQQPCLFDYPARCGAFLLILGVIGWSSSATQVQQVSTKVEEIVEETMADIVDLAVSNGNFQTLVTAVQAAGLVEALKSPGPFTVFAPVDAAFAKLPPGTVQTLVQNPPQLARILKYHVASGKHTKADLEKLDAIQSLEGTTIRLNMRSNEVKNATVIASDVEADNGIIHVLDTVILMGP
jgi:uncharacterized surface protein with fasciclin (FAS1) repeats